MSDTLLYTLLVGSLVFSTMLAVLSTAIVGRKLADLEYQKATGINGALRIQAIVNIRTHALRTLVGLTFIIISALLLADAPQIWRAWVNRILFVALPGAYAVASLLDWRAEHRQIEIQIEQAERERATEKVLASAAEQQRLAHLQTDLHDYQEMAAEAIANLKAAAAQTRETRGDAPMPEMAGVVPEHSSPVTHAQQAAAVKQTMRADLVASTLDLGLPAREAGPPATSQILVPESVDVVTIQPGALADIVNAVHEDRHKEE